MIAEQDSVEDQAAEAPPEAGARPGRVSVFARLAARSVLLSPSASHLAAGVRWYSAAMRSLPARRSVLSGLRAGGLGVRESLEEGLPGEPVGCPRHLGPQPALQAHGELRRELCSRLVPALQKAAHGRELLDGDRAHVPVRRHAGGPSAGSSAVPASRAGTRLANHQRARRQIAEPLVALGDA